MSLSLVKLTFGNINPPQSHPLPFKVSTHNRQTSSNLHPPSKQNEVLQHHHPPFHSLPGPRRKPGHQRSTRSQSRSASSHHLRIRIRTEQSSSPPKRHRPQATIRHSLHLHRQGQRVRYPRQQCRQSTVHVHRSVRHEWEALRQGLRYIQPVCGTDLHQQLCLCTLGREDGAELEESLHRL